MPKGIYKHKKLTLKTRKKMSITHLGVKNTKEHNNNISLSHIGIALTKTHRIALSLAHKGNRHTKATRKKISLSLIGNKRSLGSNTLGYKFTQASKIKMSIARKNFLKNPKKHPNWLGGLSFGNYSSKFTIGLKRKIRKRDKNICQLCDKRKYGEELAVHHIDYNKKNCKENNLIALHRRCNTKVNTNRDYWFAYFAYNGEGR